MRSLSLFLIALALGAPGMAAPNKNVAPLDEHPVPASYRFAPGDVIEVVVSSHKGHDRTLTIQPDGRIHFPRVGEIVAAGLAADQLAMRIQQGLNAQLVDPQVTVSLKEMNKSLLRRVSVLGAVKSPGSFELKEESTVAELLATAGGPTPVADLHRITVTRANGGQKAVVDLSSAVRSGQVNDNRVLEPGDLILVPEGAPPTVLVLGEVTRPGSYELQGTMRLLDALSLAGGPTPKADLRRVTLTHAGQSTQESVDLEELLTRGQPASLDANVLLKPGDTLVLPESERKYYVLGEVNKADAYPLKPADRLLDAITTAGGSTHEADLEKVVLVRKDEKGQAVARRVDLKRMMQTGEMDRNETLREGDVVFVPNRRPKRPISDYLSLLYPLSGLLSALRY